MSSSTVNWTNTDTWQRLVAAIVASGVKLDLREVAKMYGTTYDTIQNRYRKIRAEADKLKQEVNSGEREVATPKKQNKSATSTPTSKKVKREKDALSTMTNGRVTKSSPTKKGKPVKQEKKDEAEDGEDDIFAGVDFGAGSGDVSMDGDELTF